MTIYYNKYADMVFDLSIEMDTSIEHSDCCNINMENEKEINNFIKNIKIDNEMSKRLNFIASHIVNKDIIFDNEIKNKFT
jgi:hypothetical protein